MKDTADRDAALIQMPVRYDHGFIIDAEDEVVCNMLWTTHRKNWNRKDEAGQIVADAINAAAEAKYAGLEAEFDRRSDDDLRGEIFKLRDLVRRLAW